MKSRHLRSEQPFYVLIATDNQDDQFLLAQSLRSSRPTVELRYAVTDKQTQQCLLNQASEYYCFPRLLILDLQIADRQIVWELVSQIRLTYPTLPIVLISLDYPLETVQQAYTLGINAFVRKRTDWGEWKKQLSELAHYWLKVVTLPKPSPL